MTQQNETPQKNAWGGSRAGSGRKKTTAKTYTFNAPLEVADVLEAQPRKTAFINEAILFYAQHLAKGGL